MRKLGIVVVAVLVIAALGGVAGAKSKNHKVGSRVGIKVEGHPDTNTVTASGKVKSKKAVCRKHRKVVVVQDDYYSKHNLGSDFTNKAGKYLVRWSGEEEYTILTKVYAVAKRKKVGRTICKVAYSREFDPNLGTYSQEPHRP